MEGEWPTAPPRQCATLPTPKYLPRHSYWTLAGAGFSDINGDEMAAILSPPSIRSSLREAKLDLISHSSPRLPADSGSNRAPGLLLLGIALFLASAEKRWFLSSLPRTRLQLRASFIPSADLSGSAALVRCCDTSGARAPRRDFPLPSDFPDHRLLTLETISPPD